MAERPILFSAPMVQAILRGDKTQTRRVYNLPPSRAVDIAKCPHGQVGDRLWVRETFSQVVNLGVDKNGNIASELFSYNYKADLTAPIGGYWKSPRFMPRSASRITLEITNVHVERLHEITEEDALAEGITKTNLGFSYCENSYYASAKEAYESLWKSINGVQSWLDNPWVWVITFKVVEIK